MRTRIATTLSLLMLVASLAHAGYPVLDEVQGLPSPQLITVYIDNENPHLYYFLPTRVAISKHDDGSLALGVQYWGLTGLDPAGTGGALTVTLQPAWEASIVKEVADAVIKRDPAATFAVPALLGSHLDLVINGHYVTKFQDTQLPQHVTGPTVDAGAAFTVGLTNVGVRAFAQGVAQGSDVMAGTYTYKFRGVGKRLHAQITVYQRRVYDHFRATASASSWWGLVRSSWAVDWQQLRADGSIKLQILSGGTTSEDEYLLEVFKQLVAAKIAGEGMFAPKLKAGDVSGDSGGGSQGWGFSVSGGWAHTDESENFVFEIDKREIEEREFSAGLSFSAVCAKHPDSFVDLTLFGKHCISQVDFEKLQKLQQDCVDRKLERLKRLYDMGLITKDEWEKQSAATLDSGSCYSNMNPTYVDPVVSRRLSELPVSPAAKKESNGAESLSATVKDALAIASRHAAKKGKS